MFWATVETRRDEFASEVERLLDGRCATWVIREQSFFDSNSIMRDVLNVLKNVRGDVEAKLQIVMEDEGVDLILVSKRGWELSDTSSPIELPDWFPVDGGSVKSIPIIDLSWSSDIACSDRIVELDALRSKLHGLEARLLDRVIRNVRQDAHCVLPLWEYLHPRCMGQDQISAQLETYRQRLREIKNPTAYRPSARYNPTLVGHLWGKLSEMAPNEALRLAKALASAVQVENVEREEMSLMSVLNRPTTPIPEPSVRWSWVLLVSIRSACQLSTAGAHADEYPKFPSVALKSVSLDIQIALSRARDVLGE